MNKPATVSELGVKKISQFSLGYWVDMPQIGTPPRTYTLTQEQIDLCDTYANSNYNVRSERYADRGENGAYIYDGILVGKQTELAAAVLLNKPMPSFKVNNNKAKFEADIGDVGIKGCSLRSVAYVGEPTWVFNHSDINNDIRSHDPILHSHYFITQIDEYTFKLENNTPVPPETIKQNLKPLKNKNPHKRALYLSSIPKEYLIDI
jgi:hypothetical protein